MPLTEVTAAEPSEFKPAQLRWLPWLVVLAGLLVTALLWRGSAADVERNLQYEFDRRTHALADRMTEQLLNHEQSLRALASTFQTWDVSAREFHSYFEASRPYASGVPFAAMSRLVERPAASPQEVNTPILYIEPPSEINRGIIGFNSSSVPALRLAIERARNTRKVSMSSTVTLRQDSGNPTPGFVLYLATHRANGELTGWVSMSFRIQSFIEGVMQQENDAMDIALYDGAEPQPNRQIYGVAHGEKEGEVLPARFQSVQRIVFGGHTWTLTSHAPENFARVVGREMPAMVAGAGILASVLLALATLQWVRGLERRSAQAQEAQRVQREQALRDSEYATRLALDAARSALDELALQKFALDQHAIVATTDAHGKITYANDKFCQVSGYSREELMGQDHAMLNSGVHPHGFFQDMYDQLSLGVAWHGEVCNRAKAGHLYWVATTVVPVMAKDGRPAKYIAIRSDITERVLKDQELARYREHLEELVQERTADFLQSQSRLEAIFKTLTDLVWLKDADGVYLACNPVYERFAGKSEDQIVGKTDFDLVDHAQAEAYRAFDTLAMESSTPVSREEWTTFADDGHMALMETVKAAVRDDTGRVVGVLGLSRDITARKRAEEMALAASRAKSEFLANMSHEIRTPLNGVIGMVDLLEHTPLTPEQQRMLRTINQSSVSLLSILNDILDFSKIEAGKLSVEAVATELEDLVQGSVELMRSTARASVVDIATFVSPDLPRWIAVDPTRVRQVLTNLLSNAIKFSSGMAQRQAQVSVRVEPCVLPHAHQGFRLTVSDNGLGMEPALVTRLFQPFVQADASTARRYGGTGLGLSITQRLVELMGGTIAVQSALGEGSTFVIELPLEEAQPFAHSMPMELSSIGPEQAPEPAPAASAVHGHLILVAEDNETNRDVIREQLRLLGYASEVAPNGVVALQMWKEGLQQGGSGRYALLLTDCHMPQLDGFGLTEAIRACEPAGQRMPIIAITANAMAGEAQRCIARGMDDYLSKPLRKQELGVALAKWLPAVWNSHALTELVGDNPALQKRLLDKFVNNAQSQVDEMLQAAASGDVVAVAHTAHTLKSAARSVGAMALGALCQAIENAGLAQSTLECQSLASGLEPALRQVVDKIQNQNALTWEI